MIQNNHNEILSKENALHAIKVIRENNKKQDCQSVYDYINKFTDSKRSVVFI